MKIGIIGWGAVGAAVGEGFKTLGHKVTRHDPKYNTIIDEVLNTEIVFVCVPTPSKESGECDISIVYETIDSLKSKKLQRDNSPKINFSSRYYANDYR